MQNTFSLQKTLICLYHSSGCASTYEHYIIHYYYFIFCFVSHTKENSLASADCTDNLSMYFSSIKFFIFVGAFFFTPARGFGLEMLVFMQL